MILTCPECATSYFVDDSKIPTEGRAVKCANCGARWTATPELPPLEFPTPEPVGGFASDAAAVTPKDGVHPRRAVGPAALGVD